VSPDSVRARLSAHDASASGSLCCLLQRGTYCSGSVRAARLLTALPAYHILPPAGCPRPWSERNRAGRVAILPVARSMAPSLRENIAARRWGSGIAGSFHMGRVRREASLSQARRARAGSAVSESAACLVCIGLSPLRVACFIHRAFFRLGIALCRPRRGRKY